MTDRDHLIVWSTGLAFGLASLWMVSAAFEMARCMALLGPADCRTLFPL